MTTTEQTEAYAARVREVTEQLVSVGWQQDRVNEWTNGFYRLRVQYVHGEVNLHVRRGKLGEGNASIETRRTLPVRDTEPPSVEWVIVDLLGLPKHMAHTE